MKMVLVRPEENLLTNESEGQNATVKVKTPKRVLQFCDGVLEEYSTDEEDNFKSNDNNQEVVNPSTMTWGPWFTYKAWLAGSSTISVIDRVGEFLASVLGITTPRYYFELEEYRRREEQKLKQQEKETGWSQPSNASVSVPLREMSKGAPPVDV